MRVIRFDREAGELKAAVESLEDLWFLRKLLEKGDRVVGTSFRRFKSEDKLRPDSGEKKPVRLEIEVESAEIAEAANKLRVSGKILGGSPPEYAQKGAFHTIDLEPKSVFMLKKEFLPYHSALISDSRKKARQVRALIVVMDERKALLASLRNDGIKFMFELENEASKRDPKRFEEQRKAFFSELLHALESENAERTIIASPGFSKDEFRKYARERNPALERKFLYEHASNAERSAVYELLKRGALEKLISEQKVQQEFEALERLKASLGRDDGLSCYGIAEVRRALEMNAASELLIEDELLRKDKALNEYLQLAQGAGAKVLIFNSEDDAGREFSAFKVAALLRYRIA